MTDAELIETASGFREGMLQGRASTGMCAMVSWPLAGLLRFHGVECECIESDLGEWNHIWIKLPDGRALDAMADQFNRLFPDLNLPPVYLGEPTAIHPEAFK